MKSWEELKWWGTQLRHDLETTLATKETTPDPSQWYRALELTPFDQVKVVILGQDPYPTPGQAHGLAFSVPFNVKPLPPSLRNIFTEYTTDLQYPLPRSGDLTDWACRGVLLFNTALTTRKYSPNAHRDVGWGRLTTEVCQALSTWGDRICFILWGNQAQEYRGLVDESKHHVLASVHPSPLSAHRGFFGSKPFSKANDFLGDRAINWRL